MVPIIVMILIFVVIAIVVKPERDACPGGELLCLEENAPLGNSHSLYKLGLRYLNGDDVPANQTTAASYFESAAAKNHIGAQFLLGLMHKYGDGVRVDKERGAALMQRAASRGAVPPRDHVDLRVRDRTEPQRERPQFAQGSRAGTHFCAV
jgi:TPR repeat protein